MALHCPCKTAIDVTSALLSDNAISNATAVCDWLRLVHLQTGLAAPPFPPLAAVGAAADIAGAPEDAAAVRDSMAASYAAATALGVELPIRPREAALHTDQSHISMTWVQRVTRVR